MHMMIVKAIADGSGPDITGRIVPMPAGSYHLCREDDRSWFEQRSDVFSFVTQRDDSLAPTAFKLDASGNVTVLGPYGMETTPNKSIYYAVAAKIAASQPMQQSSASSLDVWKPAKTYAAGDKIFPTAYNAAATWDTGFVSTGGQLYCLVCVTAGTSGTTEPTWPDPATITNWSYGNTAGLNVTDSGVTWRIRKAVFIDPTASAGGTGTHLSPYDDWAGEVGHATGIIANDALDPAASGNTGAQYSGSVFLQRAGTTVTSASTVLQLRGPKGSVADDQSWYYYPSATTWAEARPRQLLYGAYRKPNDPPVRPKLVRTGSTGGTAAAVVYGDKKTNHQILDLDITNQQTGNKAHGVLRYQVPASSSSGSVSMVMRRCAMHDCGGHGSIFATYDGASSYIGVNGIQYYDCDFYNNEGFGAFATGLLERPLSSFMQDDDGTVRDTAVRYVRCRASNNGKASAERAYHHGFSSIAFRNSYGNGTTTGASGWTNTSGTIYSRGSLTPAAGTLTTIDDVVGVAYRSEAGLWPAILQRNTATPTAPSAGQFGYSSGTLYINLGAAIDVRTQVIVQVGKCRDIRYEDCIATGTNAYDNSGTLVEGYGFAGDEFSEIELRGCLARKNERAGFFAHYAKSFKLAGSAAIDNGIYGVSASCCVNPQITNNQIISHDYGIAGIYGTANMVVAQNLIEACDVGVAWYDAPTTPYNVTAYPFVPGVLGGGNTFVACDKNYAEYDLVSAYVTQSDLDGDM